MYLKIVREGRTDDPLQEREGVLVGPVELVLQVAKVLRATDRLDGREGLEDGVQLAEVLVAGREDRLLRRSQDFTECRWLWL